MIEDMESLFVNLWLYRGGHVAWLLTRLILDNLSLIAASSKLPGSSCHVGSSERFACFSETCADALY